MAPRTEIASKAVYRIRTSMTVSVLIAAYNSASTIRRAVESALAQAEASEVIVVDDASSDDTVKVAQASDDGSGRLKVLCLGANGGPSAARNAGLAIAQGEWFTILDSDDFMRPGRLTALLAFAAGGYDMVADDLYQLQDGAPPATARPLWFDGEGEPRLITLAEFIDRNVPRHGQARRELGFLKPLINRAFLDQRNLRYDTRMRLGEDYALYTRLLAHGARWLLTPAQGYVSVVRAGSLSGRHSIADLAALLADDDRLINEFSLPADVRSAVARHRLSTLKRVAWRRVIEAVKHKNGAALLREFGHHPSVSIALLQELSLELGRRLAGRFAKP
jgi:succinoglycan biosynthesis protein ExoU